MSAKATFFSSAQRPPLSPVPSTSPPLISRESPICEDYSPGPTPPSFQEAYDQELCPVSSCHWFVACCCWAWLGILFPCFFTAVSGACSNRTGPPLPSACESTTATFIEFSTAAQATSYDSSLPQNDDLSGPDLPPITTASPQNSISTLVLCSPESAPQPPFLPSSQPAHTQTLGQTRLGWASFLSGDSRGSMSLGAQSGAPLDKQPTKCDKRT